jgi:hypothetical protein
MAIDGSTSPRVPKADMTNICTQYTAILTSEKSCNLFAYGLVINHDSGRA